MLYSRSKRIMKRTDGYYHQRNAIVTLLISCACAGFLVIKWPLLALGIALGSVCGLFIDPDLDHEWVTVSEGRISKLFGSTIGKLFRLYWAPYEILLRHRSPLSHGSFPPFGWLIMILVATPIRMGYSVLWLLPVMYYYPTVKVFLLSLPTLLWIGLYVGWGIQDFIHWLRDFT